MIPPTKWCAACGGHCDSPVNSTWGGCKAWMIKWTSVSIVSLASFCVWSQWPLGPCLLPFSAFNNGFVLSAGECPGGCKLAADMLPNKCFKTVAQTEKCGTGEMLCFATHVLMGPALCSICNALFKWQVLPTPKQHLLSHPPPVPLCKPSFVNAIAQHSVVASLPTCPAFLFS